MPLYNKIKHFGRNVWRFSEPFSFKFSKDLYKRQKRIHYLRQKALRKHTKMAYGRGRYMGRRSYGRGRRGYSRRRTRASVTQASKSRQLGFPRGIANSKRRNVLDDAGIANLGTRTLHGTAGGSGQSAPLIRIPKTTTNDIGQRQRDLVYVSGIKLDLEFENSGTGTDENMTLNIAVITPRNSVLEPVTTDFFRASNANERGRDFNEAQLSSLDFRTLPINADDYIVHVHKRLKLGADTANTHSLSQRAFSKWIPIKRQFRFDSTSNVPTTPVPYLVHWADFEVRGQGAGVTAAAYQVLRKATLYFKET